MAEGGAAGHVKKELLQRQRISAQRGIKEPTRPERYRRGKVANSGASLQAPRPDPQAGIAESTNAKLIEQMREFVFGKGMVHDQYREAERDKGIASWEKATTEQREGYAKAIKNGWIESKESPYFREAITNAYTDNLTHVASLKMHTDYEKWPDKNDPSSDKLNEFFKEQEDDVAIQLESIPDETLKNRFYEQWQVQKRELTRRHGHYLNSEYNAKAEDEIGNKFYNMFQQYDEVLGNTFKDSNLSLNQIISEQKLTEKDYQEVAGMMSTVKGDGTLPPAQMKELEKKAFLNGKDSLWGQLYSGISDKGLPTDASYEYTGRTYEARKEVLSDESYNNIVKIQQNSGVNKITPSKEKLIKQFNNINEHSFFATRKEDKKISPDVLAAEYQKLATIVAPSEDSKTKTEQNSLIEASREPIIAMAEAYKKGDFSVISKMVNEDENTTPLKGIIADGGGAYDTLPKFVALADKYSDSTKAFAKTFQERPIEERRKLFKSYLKDNYTGGKNSMGDIWNPKKEWFVKNWEDAKFNFVHFQGYVEGKS